MRCCAQGFWTKRIKRCALSSHAGSQPVAAFVCWRHSDQCLAAHSRQSACMVESYSGSSDDVSHLLTS